MPYLPVELDALNKFPHVARAAGVDQSRISDGMLFLWAHCFRGKTDRVTLTHIKGFFGQDVSDALVAFDFLEAPAPDGAFRVKGAQDKLLSNHDARSRGGHAAKKHLVPGFKQPKGSRRAADVGAEEQPTSAPSAEPSQPTSAEVRLPSALTPNTQHPTPSTKEEEALSAPPPRADPVGAMGALHLEAVAQGAEEDRRQPGNAALRVFEHWRQRMGKDGNAKFKGKRRRAVDARLKDYSAEQLCRAVDGCAATPFNMGENDRGQRYDELELICRDSAHVERFMENARAPPKPRQETARGRASEADKDWSGPAPETTANGNLRF